MYKDVFIRNALDKDIEKTFFLSSDNDVRANSKNKDPINYDDHKKWFFERIQQKNYFIIEKKNGEFIGQIRIDNTGNEKIISVSVLNQHRSKGYGSYALKQIISKEGNVVAYIQSINIASIKLFEKIGFKKISEKDHYFKYLFIQKVFIIAEMSANHCGDLELAKKIVSKAKECGADAVKLQTYTADIMTIDCKSDYFKVSGGTLWDNKYYYDLYSEAYTPWEWQGELKKYADEIGIELFSTPFDKTAVDFLESIRVKFYKIASFEAIDLELIKYAASKQKPMIISAGICSKEEMQDAIDACKSVGNYDITLLKCTSAYPAKLEDMNVLTIPDMIEKFGSQGVKIGLSDHSMSIETVVAAVALGAKVVEKHFTLDRNLGGADAVFSLNPEELKATVDAIRNTEKVLGQIDYSVNEKNRKFARSLFVCENIKKGDKFTDENIRSIRPSDGLHPKYYNDIIGKTANRDLERGIPLKLEYVEE